MRKRFKVKRHSCKLCKSYKMGWAYRWKAKEAALLKDFEKSWTGKFLQRSALFSGNNSGKGH